MNAKNGFQAKHLFTGLIYLVAAVSIFVLSSCSHGYSVESIPTNPHVATEPGNPGGGSDKPKVDPTGDTTPSDNNDPKSNPDGSTDVAYPIRGNSATMAFEDLFPNPGDADYNDFVMNFKISEHFNPSNQLTKIEVDFVPKFTAARYDHSVLMVLDGQKDAPSNINFVSQKLFNGDADVKVVDYDASDVAIATRSYTSDQDVVIFASTKTRKAARSRLTVNVADPSLNAVTKVAPVDISKYRVVLHVINTNQDIDLVTVNPSVVFSSNYPFGLIVPIEWKYPTESTKIDEPYPKFEEYRTWLASDRTGPISDEAIHWFNYLEPGKESLVQGD